MKNFAMLAVVGLAASAAVAQNTGARLTDGSAIFDYTATGTGTLPTSSTAGGNVTMNLQIDGLANAIGTRQLFSGNWYYRISGDTRERHFANAATRTLTGTNSVTWTFGSMFGSGGIAVGGLTSSMSYTVTDTGADSVLLASSVTVNNAGNTAVVIDLFNAYDVDLAATFPGDVYAALLTSGGNRQWNFSDAAAGGPWTGAFLGIGAQGAGVGGFSAINGQMTDTGVDNFIPDLNAGGVAAADNAAAMQWRLTIPAGGSFSVDSFLAIGRNGAEAVVPTPGAAALLGLGGLVALRRRRTA